MAVGELISAQLIAQGGRRHAGTVRKSVFAFSISFSLSFAYLVPELPVHLCPSKAAYQPM
jgi:hypothetical protein